jgi:hypothetical protein
MQLEVGKIYEGTVTGITKFGAFVELEKGTTGMVHISEVANTYVNDINEHITQGQQVKVKVLSLGDVPRRGAFARAALAGGFFWGGTRGATLSVGADDALYLTERRAVDELSDGDALDACLDEFALTAADWRERSRLYA